MAGDEGRGPATRRFSWNSHGIWEFFRGFRMDLNPDQTEPYLRKSGNPEAGLVGQVLVHPSHFCQIGGSDQDPFADSNRSPHAPQIPFPDP